MHGRLWGKLSWLGDSLAMAGFPFVGWSQGEAAEHLYACWLARCSRRDITEVEAFLARDSRRTLNTDRR